LFAHNLIYRHNKTLSILFIHYLKALELFDDPALCLIYLDNIETDSLAKGAALANSDQITIPNRKGG